jgi:peptidoglycan/xylan/chitin deacetylase (PgdA/CDA1 family)
MATLLVGYDIESDRPEGTRRFIDAVRALHRRLDHPFTLFCVGRTVELQPDYFAELARDPLIDLQSHTYSHRQLKTVWMTGGRARLAHGGTTVFRGCTVAEAEDEIARGNRVLEAITGRATEGLTAPWNHYRGFGDRPDLLDLCARHGIRFLRSWGRDRDDAQPTPWQEPFAYAEQGHADLLECFIHGYQDDYYYAAFCPQPHRDGFRGHLVEELVPRIAREDLRWSACAHDHIGSDADLARKLAWLEPFLVAAKDAGIEGLDYRRFYHRRMARMTAAGAA